VSVIVVCPKCTKRQPVTAAVPPDGLRFSCAYCQTTFLVKLPRAATPPAAPPPAPSAPPRSSRSAPARALEAGPPGLDLGDPVPSDEFGGGSGTVAMDPTEEPTPADLPVARKARSAASHADLPAPSRPLTPEPFQLDFLPAAKVKAPPPRPDDGFSIDLPAPRDAMPLPGDLPASKGLERGSGSSMELELNPSGRGRRTDELTIGSSPGFSLEDLEPGSGMDPDLPNLTLEPEPDTGDLPIARESMPLPDDFLAPRESVPRPGDLPASRESMPLPGDLVASRETVPRPGDFLAAREDVPRPDDLLATRDALGLARNLPSPVGSSGGRGNLPSPVGTSGGRGNLPSPIGNSGPRGNLPTSKEGDAPFDPFNNAAYEPTGVTPLAPLDLGDAPPLPTLGASFPDANGGFGLELEGSSQNETREPSAPIKVSLPAGMTRQDGVEALAPISSSKRKAKADPTEMVAPSRKRMLLIGGGAGGAAVLTMAAVVMLKMHPGEPKVDDVLGPLALELQRDQYASYQRSVDKLLEANGRQPEAVGLRGAAAEQLLLAYLAHGGEKAKLSQAEQLVMALPTHDKPVPAIKRARALLAVAKGRGQDVAGILGTEADTPEGQLVLGLRDLWAHRSEAAVTALQRFTLARPEHVIGHYLLGKAMEESEARAAQAHREYQSALAASPNHFGAALGMARLAGSPAQRLEAIEKLVTTRSGGAPRTEMSDAYVAMGRAAEELGRSADATSAFVKALAQSPQSPVANVQLGEAYMAEGRFADALQRFQASGPAGMKTADGRFGLGGALIANGMSAEGLAQVQQAAQESPKDPRGVYYAGFAAELATPPDYEAAAQNYRAAMALDSKFLPAALRLAALMQRQDKPDEALAILKRAEEAGAPPAALQIAWGNALVVAKQPGRAEEVFRRAIAASPSDAPGFVGLATALDAQNKSDEARQVLEKVVAALPDSLALRENLATIDTKLGRRDEAITQYKAELDSGNAPLSVRVSLGKLLLEQGRLDEAKSELDKVVEENPGTQDALHTMARLWEARGDVGRAISEYRRALRFEPTPAVQLGYARALLKTGKEQEAMGALDAAVTLPEGLIERGRLLYRTGDYERSLADFEAAAKSLPRDTQALLWLGASRDKMGQQEGAAEAWKAGLRVAPDHPEILYRLGRFELDKGRLSPALEHLRKAREHVTDKADYRAELFFQLATAEITAGKKAPALEAFRKYLDIAPPDAAARPEAMRQVARLTR
jgi:tetratricopeptide (TPR) repeat protein